jgi:hypothetical protein
MREQIMAIGDHRPHRGISPRTIATAVAIAVAAIAVGAFARQRAPDTVAAPEIGAHRTAIKQFEMFLRGWTSPTETSEGGR